MGSVQVASNIWIDKDDPEGVGNNHHQAAKRLPGDIGIRLIVGSVDRRMIDNGLLLNRFTRQQYEEYLTWKFFMPHNHAGDEWINPDPVLPKRDALLASPVENLGLSVRALNCLRNNSVSTLGELVAVDREEMSKWRNLGSIGLKEIEDMLGSLGLDGDGETTPSSA